MICEICGHDIQIGEYPFCKGTPTSHMNARGGVISDDIPGGYLVKNGICWPDGTPRKFYSKSEIRKTAHAAGLTIGGETPKSNSQVSEKRHQEREARAKNRG